MWKELPPGYAHSSQIPNEQRICQNCIFMELDKNKEPYCTPSYRKRHAKEKPHCARWDGGIMVKLPD